MKVESGELSKFPSASLKVVGGCRWSVTGRERAARRSSGESSLAGELFRGNFRSGASARQNNNKPLVCTNVAETNQKRFARNEEKKLKRCARELEKIENSQFTRNNRCENTPRKHFRIP